MSSEKQSLQPEIRDLLIALGIFAVFCLIFYSIGDKHQGRHNFPCYCKPCEETLIKKAVVGDAASIQKLETSPPVTEERMSPFALLIGFVLVVLLFVGIPMVLMKPKSAPSAPSAPPASPTPRMSYY